MKIGTLHVDPTCHTLSLSSPCFSLCCTFAVMAPTPPEAPPVCRGRRGGRSRFPGRRASPSHPRRLPELATCLTPVYALPLLSFSFLCSPWTAFEQAHRLHPNPRAPLHGFQIHRNQSSTTFLASSSTPPSRASSTKSPGTEAFPAASH